MENRVSVITPEYVQIQFETAGVGSRVIAKLIDYVLITLIFTLLLILSIPVVIDMSEMVGEEMGFILAALYLVVFAALPLAYLVLTEYFMGRTVGKWLLGLRLITDTGQSPGFWSIFLRNILILADQFFLIGLIFMWLHGKEQRIGDLAAGTLVIYERKKREGSLPAFPLSEEEKDGLRRYDQLGDDQYLLIEEFLKRRRQMNPQRRKRMSEKLLQWIQAEEAAERGDAEKRLEKIYLYLKQTRYPSIS